MGFASYSSYNAGQKIFFSGLNLFFSSLKKGKITCLLNRAVYVLHEPHHSFNVYRHTLHKRRCLKWDLLSPWPTLTEAYMFPNFFHPRRSQAVLSDEPSKYWVSDPTRVLAFFA